MNIKSFNIRSVLMVTVATMISLFALISSNTITVAQETAALPDVLSAEEVEDILVGNTMVGTGKYQGTPYQWAEHYSDGDVDGTWRNSTVQRGESYDGSYEVRDDGTFCSNDWCFKLRPTTEEGAFMLVDSSDSSIGEKVAIRHGRDLFD